MDADGQHDNEPAANYVNDSDADGVFHNEIEDVRAHSETYQWL